MSETNTALTPYDTGARLEPQVWPLRGPSLGALIGINPRGLGPVDPDRYGLVDFDDEEGATVFTIVGKKRDDGSEGYLLSIDNNDEASTVEINGDRVLVLDEDTLAGLETLIDMDSTSSDRQRNLAERAIKKIQGARA